MTYPKFTLTDTNLLYDQTIVKSKVTCWDLQTELHKHAATSQEYADTLTKLNDEIKYLKMLEAERDA